MIVSMKWNEDFILKMKCYFQDKKRSVLWNEGLPGRRAVQGREVKENLFPEDSNQEANQMFNQYGFLCCVIFWVWN